MLAEQRIGLRHVVAVSSPGCNADQPPQMRYQAPGQEKASMEFLVRLHARRLAKRGINVDCVISGFVATEIDARMRSPTPSQAWLEPPDIGEAVAFPCYHRARHVTGVALPVDGGRHLKG